MKRFVLIFFVVFPLALFAQKTSRIAVMEPIKVTVEVTVMQCQIVRGGLETAAVNASGYDVYDRASFDAILREQNIQVSSAISELQIKKIGELAGVQYVVVSEITAEGDDFYILVKMFDVEKGKYGTVYEKLCGKSSAEIKNVCAELGDSLFVADSNVGKSEKTKKDYTETAFDLDMRMIYVEGGTFMMGCTDEQGSDCDDDEKLTRETSVSSFYIGMLEVSQSQWFKVMGTEPNFEPIDTVINGLRGFVYPLGFSGGAANMYEYYKYLKDDYGAETNDSGEYISYLPTWGYDHLDETGPDYPMYLVPQGLVYSFLEKLSKETGKKYDLPTEAQWEYAARGGNKSRSTKYAGSNNLDEVAWYLGNSDSTVHRCGMRKPNELGIYDMSGNVGEWCRDVYGDSYLQYDNDDPLGPDEPDGWWPGAVPYVVRGGCWRTSDVFCRVSCRGDVSQESPYNSVGFRVVCIP